MTKLADKGPSESNMQTMHLELQRHEQPTELNLSVKEAGSQTSARDDQEAGGTEPTNGSSGLEGDALKRLQDEIDDLCKMLFDRDRDLIRWEHEAWTLAKRNEVLEGKLRDETDFSVNLMQHVRRRLFRKGYNFIWRVAEVGESMDMSVDSFALEKYIRDMNIPEYKLWRDWLEEKYKAGRSEDDLDVLLLDIKAEHYLIEDLSDRWYMEFIKKSEFVDSLRWTRPRYR